MSLLLSLEALVGLLGIVQPAGVVNGDLVAGSRRAGASATGNNLSLDTHCEFCCVNCTREKVEKVMSTRGADSYFSRDVGKLPAPYAIQRLVFGLAFIEVGRRAKS